MSAGLRLLASITEHGSTTALRELDRSLFVDDDELRVYDFLRSHYRRYSEFPVIETVEEQTGVSLPETPEHLDYYLEEVRNRSVYNQVRDHFGNLRAKVMDNDIPGMLSIANGIRRACTPYTGHQREIVEINELADDIQAEYSRHAEAPGFSGIPTGWGYLDKETGGYQNGDLVVWVARPGEGKTHLLIHQSRTAWMEHKCVLFVSMEMTLRQIGMRLAAHHAGLDPDRVRKGCLSCWGAKRLKAALEEFRDANNFHLYAGNFKKTTDDLDILIQEISPDIVYVDGLYIMKPVENNSRMGRFERVANVVDDLKRMALMRDRPVVATTQFSREAGKGGKHGSMDNLGYTDALSTHSSLIMAIKSGLKERKDTRENQRVCHRRDDGTEEWRTELVTTGSKDIYPTRLIEILKGREGESGAFGIRYKFAPLDFSQVPLIEVRGSEVDPDRANINYMSRRG